LSLALHQNLFILPKQVKCRKVKASGLSVRMSEHANDTGFTKNPAEVNILRQNVARGARLDGAHG